MVTQALLFTRGKCHKNEVGNFIRFIDMATVELSFLKTGLQDRQNLVLHVFGK